MDINISTQLFLFLVSLFFLMLYNIEKKPEFKIVALIVSFTFLVLSFALAQTLVSTTTTYHYSTSVAGEITNTTTTYQYAANTELANNAQYVAYIVIAWFLLIVFSLARSYLKVLWGSIHDE